MVMGETSLVMVESSLVMVATSLVMVATSLVMVEKSVEKEYRLWVDYPGKGFCLLADSF